MFAVATSPATFAQWCRGADGTWTEIQRAPLDGAGSELRLRLVNGWVWINDVDSGAAWVTSPQQRLDRVEDWGNILSDLDDESDDDNTDEEGGEVITEVNPDDPNAEIVQSDEIDTEGPNQPPIARDDEAQTRVDRPIDVDVLVNDTDPNGDVLVVTAVEPAGGDALIDIAPDGRSVQVSPAAGYAGPVTFGYTITDGRDASAVGERDRRRAPVRRQRQPAARGAQRHRLDPPRPADDVRRARQRRRPRRRRPRARLDRPGRRRGRQRRRARARPVRPGRVHARPEHDDRAHRADLHGQRRLRRHRRRPP